ncbi:ABC transporter permease [Paenibacillus arenilitoris]|uniref:ABC transporter permease n=1 Tax=Paenibacillus arenilitoris TaxID=2772299 RepID=A0A927H7M8_9BACL|nr:ABC transporter permease [Paenibacillus arenilitoris]MBD2869749.1 ABC transporter permease [Paenibacillus arenilitoris]
MAMLMRLELRKIRLRNWLLSFAAANLVIAMWVVTNLPNEGVRTFVEAFYSNRSYVEMTFIVFSSVFMSKLVMDEYKSKTVANLFAYPIARSRLLAAKLIVTALFSFAASMLSNLFVAAFFLAANAKNGYIAEPLTSGLLTDEALRIFINAFAVTGVVLLPLYVGMARKSGNAIIVASFVLALGLGGSHDESGHNWTLAAAIAACCVGAGFVSAAFAVRKAEREDIL